MAITGTVPDEFFTEAKCGSTAPLAHPAAYRSNLCRTLDQRTADALAAAIAKGRKVNRGTLSELRDPWET